MAQNKPVPLGTLRAFEAVGRHCHVRRAAEELCLTHSALSRQVRNLEAHLQVQLFNRENNRLTLTAAGRRFLTVVQKSLDQLQQGALYLDPDSMTGELVIAVTPSISMGWLIPVMGAFVEHYPEIVTRIISIEPHQRVLPKGFDIALCLGQPESSQQKVRALYQEHYLPVCRPSLLMDKQPITTPNDLLNYPLLHERFNHWQKWFGLQNLVFTRGSRNIHFDYGFQSIEAARRGLGIALADRVEVAQDLRNGRLIRLLDAVLPVDESIYLVTEIESKQSLRTRLFVNHMLKDLVNLGAMPADSGQN